MLIMNIMIAVNMMMWFSACRRQYGYDDVDVNGSWAHGPI